jgi:hypothetical protein
MTLGRSSKFFVVQFGTSQGEITRRNKYWPGHLTKSILPVGKATQPDEHSLPRTKGAALAVIGHRWLGMERAMGIEHTTWMPLRISDQIVASMDRGCVRFSCEKPCDGAAYLGSDVARTLVHVERERAAGPDVGDPGTVPPDASGTKRHSCSRVFQDTGSTVIGPVDYFRAFVRYKVRPRLERALGTETRAPARV